MDYDLTVPCKDCPFRKVGGVKLPPARIREISNYMLHPQGAAFPCHKTASYDDEGEPDALAEGQKHCAGGLIYAEKQGRAHQMMRICERIGMYDPTKFTARAKALVWDNLGQWLKGGTLPTRRRKPKATDPS